MPYGTAHDGVQSERHLSRQQTPLTCHKHATGAHYAFVTDRQTDRQTDTGIHREL